MASHQQLEKVPDPASIHHSRLFLLQEEDSKAKQGNNEGVANGRRDRTLQCFLLEHKSIHENYKNWPGKKQKKRSKEGEENWELGREKSKRGREEGRRKVSKI
ncbi:unnamed protein product [Cuscuta epithymum]|uniref:Uncharacterized protein n=1 Tax=Cuscuta epithymum TaxID=186058 RepID=A0AAV0BXI9_9ASTE|nr:unnamed protein product [Cuscuta epithymum]